jgi:dUTP pyrophosphatase
MNVKIQLLRPTAAIPAYMTPGAAGLDISADIQAAFVLQPGQRAGVATGLALQLPIGFEAQVRPRSGLARDTGVTVLNAPGTIDSDYRGEIIVLLINLGAESVTIRPAMRIAQLVIAPVIRATIEIVSILDDTGRGSAGFGSTGLITT